MADLMDRLIDHIRQFHEETEHFFSTDTIGRIYTYTHDRSKLRLYCAAYLTSATLYASEAKASVHGAKVRENWAAWLDDFGAVANEVPDLFRDIWLVMGKYGHAIDSRQDAFVNLKTIFTACHFHVHGPGDVCYLKTDNALPDKSAVGAVYPTIPI